MNEVASYYASVPYAVATWFRYVDQQVAICQICLTPYAEISGGDGSIDSIDRIDRYDEYKSI